MSTKSSEWFVVAIGGVTCGGKSTLANSLHDHIPNSNLIRQDDYFYPVDSPHHVKVKNLDHINFDVLTALDMEKMLQDILAVLNEDNACNVNGGQTTNGVNHVQIRYRQQNGNSSNFKKKNILILEGFSLFNYKPISDLCDLKFEIQLTREECYRRRCLRKYDPPDIPGYFEMCVWPEYLKNKEKLKNDKNIIPLDGTSPDLLTIVLEHMRMKID